MWREVLGEADFLRRRRLSRIYYNKRFFFYPLRVPDTLRGLGLWNSLLIVASYLKAQLFPQDPERTFEQWVANRFGARLYRTFFKAYTEKVWGIPCHGISAEWAAQRIKNLSLLAAVKHAFLQRPPADQTRVIPTLIDAFDYPRLGPGQMWTTVADIARRRGSAVRCGALVDAVRWADNRVVAVEVGGELVRGSHFISSMPLRELIQKLSPGVPEEVQRAAAGLNYRDFLTVALIVNQPDLFPDNWIYIHDPGVRMGRVQNFKNWSPDMVPSPDKTCLGLEYFCFEGDDLWTMADRELIELGKRELQALGLARAVDVEDGTVVRMPKAYPVYDIEYAERLAVVRKFLDSIDNLQVIGRNGMHKYNNQDHSMHTAMLAVRNILGDQCNVWRVNADQDFHGERARVESAQRPLPERLTTAHYEGRRYVGGTTELK
jgi:protoporphyrinogen oxidase